MMPCQPHFVFGYTNSVCLGGHYYLTNHMQKTLQGLVHSFVLHNFLTNTSHPTGVLLRRIIIFFHMGLVEKGIPASGMPYIFCISMFLKILTGITDPAASHLPNVDTMDGLMNLLSACVLVVLGNVLDFRTYRAPTQEENQEPNKNQAILIENDINTIPVNERFAICYSRGLALHLMDWIRRFSVITGPGGDIIRDLPSSFLVQIASTLSKYKINANISGLELDADCKSHMLMTQIENVVKVDPLLVSMWADGHLFPSNSLALAKQDEYSVKWQSDIPLQWSNKGMFKYSICYSITYIMLLDFFQNGVTELDKLFFRAQKRRQQMELEMIPQLTVPASSGSRPSKRIKISR